MNRPWLAQYPEGVPAEIPSTRPKSVVAMFEAAYKQYAERTAYECLGASLTYRQVDELSRHVAAWLQLRGLERGARVAVMMPNVLPYMVIVSGILRAGGVVVNVNPQYTARELRIQLQDANAEFIFVLENFAHTLQEVCPDCPMREIVVIAMGDAMPTWRRWLVNTTVRHIKRLVPAWKLSNVTRWSELIRAGRQTDYTPADPESDDCAFLQYTGGTTGRAKGAILTHGNLVANVMQAELWFSPLLGGAQNHERQWRMVVALPLYHIFSLMASGIYGTRMGMCNLLIPNPRDIPAFIGELRKHPPHLLPAVNTLFNALLHHADFHKVDWSQLRMALGGGMAVQRAVAERWKKATGVHVLEAYGLSETSPAVTINPVTINEYNGTIGVPIPSTEVILVDGNDQPVPIGEAGELAVRGPQVMPGYWNLPEETANAFTADGFFKTGDIAVMNEDGFVRIVDRKKDMIVVSGFNVYPNEVEGEMAQHPGVLEVAAVGVPDEHSGEAVKLYVVPKDTSVTEEALRTHCRERLSPYKCPKSIEFRDDLPKTNVGKILRRALRDENQAKSAEPGGGA